MTRLHIGYGPEYRPEHEFPAAMVQEQRQAQPIVVTRFNPNCNGSLHLGHLYTMLVNEQFAHSRRGKFVLRFEDTCASMRLMVGDRYREIRDRQREDIEWLDIPVDEWVSQEELLPKVHDAWRQHDYEPIETDEINPVLPLVVGLHEQGLLPYPWTPRLTAERVWLDWFSQVTHVIRGIEFMTEYALYQQLCATFLLPPPEFVFVPRLMSMRGDISKTNGGYKIAEFRANGWTPQQVIDLVTQAALRNQANGWHFYNLKAEPRVAL